MLKHYAANRKRLFQRCQTYVHIYTTLAFLALLGAPYIYDISSLRVNIILTPQLFYLFILFRGMKWSKRMEQRTGTLMLFFARRPTVFLSSDLSYVKCCCSKLLLYYSGHACRGASLSELSFRLQPARAFSVGKWGNRLLPDSYIRKL